MKLVVVCSLALFSVGGASAASAQTAAPLEFTQQVGAWTVSDTGGKPGDDSDRDVMLSRSIEGVDFVLHRGSADGAGITLRFSRCDGMTVNSGFSFEGGVPARVAELKDQIHDAFNDFAKRCPVKAGEEAALLEGLEPATRAIETRLRDRPFTYPPEPAPEKP